MLQRRTIECRALVFAALLQIEEVMVEEGLLYLCGVNRRSAI